MGNSSSNSKSINDTKKIDDDQAYERVKQQELCNLYPEKCNNTTGGKKKRKITKNKKTKNSKYTKRVKSSKRRY